MTIPKTETVVRVVHPQRPEPFLLSFMSASLGGMCVSGYEVGKKRPSHGRHWLLTDVVRQWLDELVECPETLLFPLP